MDRSFAAPLPVLRVCRSQERRYFPKRNVDPASERMSRLDEALIVIVLLARRLDND